MYLVYVEADNGQRSDFETIFTGEDEKYPDLKSALKAANDWIESDKSRSGFSVKYRIMGCL